MIIKCRGIISPVLYRNKLQDLHNKLRIDLHNSLYRQVISFFLSDIYPYEHPNNKSSETTIDPLTALVKGVDGPKNTKIDYMCIYCLRSAILNTLMNDQDNIDLIQKYLKLRTDYLNGTNDTRINDIKKFKRIMDNDPRFSGGLTKSRINGLIDDELDIDVEIIRLPSA